MTMAKPPQDPMELVRVRVGSTETNLSRAFAEMRELEVLTDEPTHNNDGTVRRVTGRNGRPLKPRTDVDAAAAKKTAPAKKTATRKAAAKKAAAPAAAPTTGPTSGTASTAVDPAKTAQEAQ